MNQVTLTLLAVCVVLLLVVSRSDAGRLCDTQLVYATFVACGIAKRSPPPLYPQHHQLNEMQSGEVITFSKRLANPG